MEAEAPYRFVQPPLVMERAKWKHDCPMCRGYLRDRGGVWTCDWCGFEPHPEQRYYGDDAEDGWMPALERVARMLRLGKSVEELAKDQIESIMGYEGPGGHKPPRPDIQKMKNAYDLFNRAYTPHGPRSELAETDEQFADATAAREEWHDKYGLDNNAIQAVSHYNRMLRFYGDAQRAFDTTATEVAAVSNLPTKEDGRRFLSQALKKYEQQNWPMLYEVIKDTLDDAYRVGIDSYKLWPRMVTWIKEEYQRWLMNENMTFNRDNQSTAPMRPELNHIRDITTEGGKVLDELRRENRLPQNFDVNKINFGEFENWLMDWKHENRQAESQGQVVYEFRDGWTIQKLTTPEQLQFEGDEQGHCVGGYCNPVQEGSTIIYSLRDPKGMPHVTMEVRAILNHNENPETGDIGEAYYVHPDLDSYEDLYGRDDDFVGTAPDKYKTFEVVQVQGNSNKTPKPEYQRKIKEFLDYLRSKGWKFVRSDDWFAPFDDPGQEEYGEVHPRTAEDLDEWYDNHYKTHHEQYRGIGEGDAYGLPAERATIGIPNWDELFEDSVHSLINEYNQHKWQGEWKSLAQAVWHAWIIDIYKDHLDSETLKRHEQNLIDQIQRTEDVLQGWSDQFHFDTMTHNPEVVLDKFEELAEKEGLATQFEERVDQTLEEEYGDTTTLPYDANARVKVQIAESEYEDLWVDAQDALREDVENETYGDAYKFCQYLYMLAMKSGVVNPQDLPDPNERHGGLPSYEELQEMPWKDDEEQNKHPMGELNLPGALSKVVTAEWKQAGLVPDEWHTASAPEYQIHPIDHEHNAWFDTDGNQRARYRPSWVSNPETGKMEQTGPEEDTFLDKHGRQGQGWVAYKGDNPIGSLTYVDDNGWHMIGTTYVHPDHRQQGIFNQLSAPLRATGKPISAYVWETPWLRDKVHSWNH